MEKCKECGMPLDEKTCCACNSELCYHCCACGPECTCGCQEKE
ncbi:MAG: hypothetical protein WC675_00420 [Patescibacteria group bacterium]